MLTSYAVTLAEKELCAGKIGQFRFSRPDGYAFEAGQWFRLTLGTTEGTQTATFSHASAPGDPLLEMATRMSGSAFKRALDAMEPGGSAVIAGPGGRLRLPEPDGQIVFLVGGVGITPVHSLLREAVARGRRFDGAVLIFGNRDESCVLYREELSGMAAQGVRLVEVLEEPLGSWDGETGLISPELVRRHVDTAESSVYMVTGPPVMVEAMERVLDSLGVADEARIVESFGAATRPAPQSRSGDGTT
jgi:ferredoxin-NADP reductase